jgi:hypothetical protein
MPTFVTRLDLSSGRSLIVGQKWLSDDKYPVGLIIDRAEELTRLDEATTEKTAASYEVWLLPADLCAALFKYYHDVSAHMRKQSAAPDAEPLLLEMRKAENVVCRRVQASTVAFTEEVVVIKEAHAIIHEFFVEKIQEDEEPLEAELGAPNGPDAR